MTEMAEVKRGAALVDANAAVPFPFPSDATDIADDACAGVAVGAAQPSAARDDDRADPVGLRFADAPERTVEVERATIRYRLWDDAPAHAPSLLFLHGFRAHSHWWDHIIPYFQERYRIAAMDFSGLGNSGWRTQYTMRNFAREVIAVVEAAELTPVKIIAHSFGGSPAAFASALRPDLFDHIIMIDSRMILDGMPEPEQHELTAFSPGRRIYPDLDVLRARYRLIPSAGHVRPELIDHIARLSARPVDDGWTWKFDETFDPQLTADFDRTVPPGGSARMDYIYGEQSDVVTPELAERIVALLPGCSAPIAIPESNHHVLLEQPLALVAVLRALLAQPSTAHEARRARNGRAPTR
jgi:pimeloyl-ACP methyl ester carboxylesterase